MGSWRRKTKLMNQMVKVLSPAEVEEWQKLERKTCGLTSYEMNRFLDLMAKAGIVKITPATEAPG
jgi:hypothetical protein